MPGRTPKAPLSYIELIEVAVVATLRNAGLSLSDIRNTRAYMAKEWNAQYPFAEYHFQTDGKNLFVKLKDVMPTAKGRHLVTTNKGGKLAWAELMSDRLSQFEYEKNIVMRWHLRGKKNAVVIDPRVSFGEPTVRGIPTLALRGRYAAGESIEEISEDFRLKDSDVKEALIFEGVLEAA